MHGNAAGTEKYIIREYRYRIGRIMPADGRTVPFFKRVSIHNLERISEDELVHRLETEHQALCILNTRKRAQKIYQQVKGEGVYHLSTTMYPVHRKAILDKIRSV